jgi:hypothetical protein
MVRTETANKSIEEMVDRIGRVCKNSNAHLGFVEAIVNNWME